VLEGRGTPGGRVRTEYSHFSYPNAAPQSLRGKGIPVDLGGSWIHGVQGAGNPIFSLSVLAKTPVVKSRWERGVLFKSDGTRASEAIMIWWLKLMSDVTEFFEEELDDPHVSISEALDDYLNLNNLGKSDMMTSDMLFPATGDDESVGSSSEESETKSNLSADLADPVSVSKELQRSLARIALVIAGEWEWAERMEALSAKNSFQDGETLGADVLMPEGYWTIFERTFMKDLQNDIVYNAEVVKVTQPSGGGGKSSPCSSPHSTASAASHSNANNSPPPASGSRSARVASAPPKLSASSSSPSLPSISTINTMSQSYVTVTTADGKQHLADRVISTLPLGVLKRDVVKFSPAISDHKCVSMARVGYGSMNKIYVQFEEAFWEPEGEVQPHVVIWMNDAGTGRLTIGVNHNVLVPHSNILCILATGEAGPAVEQMTDERILDEIMTNLRRCYGPNTPQPCNHMITRWAKDKWSYGSYASLVLGSSHDDLRELARPEGRLHFAGEHTATEYLGSVHGAYLSGMRAATEVLAACNKPAPVSHESFPVDDDLKEA